MAIYPFRQIEPKWQARWDREQTFRTPTVPDLSKPKYYALDMWNPALMNCPWVPPL